LFYLRDFLTSTRSDEIIAGFSEVNTAILSGQVVGSPEVLKERSGSFEMTME